MDEEKCKDCFYNSTKGCILDKKPEECEAETPLPLVMEVGLL